MATNVPPPTFGPNGFVAPSGPAVFTGVCADIAAAFGSAMNFALTTPQGQLASSEAACIVNANAVFVYYTNQVDPAYATGRMQDAIARIYFLERIASEPTVLQIQCTGNVGVVIAVGSLIKDVVGNIYASTDLGSIQSGGTVTIPFAAQIPGPAGVPAAGDVSIYQVIPGWDSVSCLSGVMGRDAETRAEFEARRQATVAQNSIGSLPSIRGAVLAVDGVLDAYVTENDTGSTITPTGVNVIAHSVYVAVTGGDADDVARAIWSKKAPGCNYNGNTTVVVEDDNSGYSPPLPSYNVTFERPSALAILFSISINNNAQVPSDAVTQIQDAMLAAFEGEDGGPRASIGSLLYALRYVAPVAALGSWAQITALGIGSNNTVAGVMRGRIAGTVFTVDAVVSGAVAVGNTLSDAAGAILPGQRIASLGTGSGGVGTYNVTISQTIGASFTGTGSGTNLTASAVTGIIAVGDVVSGTGVPANTTISSQTSGTTGGAGVYVTNNATTSAGNALLASDVVTAAANTGSQQQVRIDQQPTLTANNVQVTLV